MKILSTIDDFITERAIEVAYVAGKMGISQKSTSNIFRLTALYMTYVEAAQQKGTELSLSQLVIPGTIAAGAMLFTSLVTSSDEQLRNMPISKFAGGVMRCFGYAHLIYAAYDGIMLQKQPCIPPGELEHVLTHVFASAADFVPLADQSKLPSYTMKDDSD